MGLEKVFNMVPREKIWWAMHKLDIEEWLVRVVMSLYENVKSNVRLNGKLGEEFDVSVGVHQSSILSPLLFIVALEAVSLDFRSGLPWEMRYPDDLVLIAKSLEKLTETFEQ